MTSSLMRRKTSTCWFMSGQYHAHCKSSLGRGLVGTAHVLGMSRVVSPESSLMFRRSRTQRSSEQIGMSCITTSLPMARLGPQRRMRGSRNGELRVAHAPNWDATTRVTPNESRSPTYSHTGPQGEAPPPPSAGAGQAALDRWRDEEDRDGEDRKGGRREDEDVH